MALNYTKSSPDNPQGVLNYSLNEVDPKTGLDIREGNRHTAPLNYIRVPQSSLYVTRGSVSAPYRRIVGDNYHPEFSSRGVQEQLAANQSSGSQFVNFLTQGVLGEAVGGTIEGLGYLTDWRGPAALADDGEQSFGEILSTAGKSLRTWTEEAAPIYTDPGQKEFAPGHWSWWMKNGKSVFSTLSLMIPAAGASGAIGAIAKYAGITSKMSKATKAASSIIGQATMSRHMENMMEAGSSYDEVYKRSIADGMSEADAIKKASIAASNTYKADWGMLLMDIAQYTLLAKAIATGKTPMSSGAKKLLGSTELGSHVPAAKALVGQMGGEAFEEGYQWIATEEGKYAAEKAFNPSMQGTFGDRMGKYVRDGELWTNAVFGALGGGLFSVAGKAANKLANGADDQVTQIKDWATTAKTIEAKLDMAASMGDEYMLKEGINDWETLIGIRGAASGMIDQSMAWFDRISDPNTTEEDLTKLNLDKATVGKLMSGDIQKSKANIQSAANRYLKNYNSLTSPGTDYNKAVTKAYNSRPKRDEKISFEGYAKRYAANLTMLELQLDNMIRQQNEVKTKITDATSRIANFGELSNNRQHRLLRVARAHALQKQRSIIEKQLEKKDLPEKARKDLEVGLTMLDKFIDLHNKELTKLDKDYESEDPEVIKSDKLINFNSVALDELKEAEGINARFDAHIASFQKTIDRYKKGDILTKEEVEQLNLTDEEETNDEPDIYNPELSDIVSWIDNNGNEHYGVVERFNEKDDTLVDVREIDDEYNDIKGERAKPKLKTDLKLADRERDREIQKTYVEPLASGDYTDEEEYRLELENAGINKALSDLINSLSTSHIDRSRPTGIAIRDLAFDAYLSDPKNQLEGAVATYSIDWANKLFWERTGKKGKEFQRLYNQSRLTKKNVDEYLSIDKENVDNYSVELVDKIPIKVSIKVPGQEEPFEKQLYVHDSDFWNVNMPDQLMLQGMDPAAFVKMRREEARSARREIITALLDGKVVTTTNLKKMTGWFNNIGRQGNIHERIGVASGSLPLYVAVKSLGGQVDIASSPKDTTLFGQPNKPGGIYIRTNKTSHGGEVLVKVNPAKLSAEHADILFEAIKQRNERGQGLRAKSRDERVQGLTVQEVINLLALFGNAATNPKHKDNADMPDYLHNKALYVRHERAEDRTYTILHFGTETLNLFDRNPEQAAADKQRFIDWATKNKNYRIPLGFKYGPLAGFELNKPMKKKFRIGSFTNIITDENGKEHLSPKPYSALMMDTVVDRNKEGEARYMISTDIDRVKNPTTGQYIESITHNPLVDLNIRSIVAKEPQKPKEPVKPAEPEVVQDKSNIHFTLIRVKALNVGSVLWYEDKSSDTGKTIFGSVELDYDGNTKIIKLNEAFSSVPKTSSFRQFPLRTTESSTKKFNDLKAYMSAGNVKLGWDENPITDYPGAPGDISDMPPVGFEVGSHTFKESTPIISDKDFKWLYKRFGNIATSKVDKLIEIAGRQGKTFYGTFEADCITIFDQAPGEVLYHEAFHRVSLGYLSDPDRERVYAMARKYYELPDASNEHIEETLANSFMEYKAAAKQPKRKGFFKYIVDLYDFIVTFITGKSKLRAKTIEELFDYIEQGRFKYSKISNERKTELAGKRFGYEIGGVDIEAIANLKDLNDVVKALTSALLRVNHVEDINDVPKITMSKLWHYIDHAKDLADPNDKGGILQQFKAIRDNQQRRATNPLLTTEDRSNASLQAIKMERLITLYEAILTPANKPIFEQRIDAALRSYNIVKKEVEEDDEGESEVGEETRRFISNPYEFNIMDNVLASIKFLIATLPASDKVNEATWTIQHVDFGEAWRSLLFDLWHLDSIDQMLAVIESKADIYYYKVLAQKLRAGSDMLRTQFKVSVNKHKHEYINYLFHHVQGRENDPGKFTFYSSKSDIFSASRRERLAWSDLFMSSEVVDQKGEPKIDKTILTNLIKDYNNIRQDFSKLYNSVGGALSKDDFNKYISYIPPFLQRIGIDIDRATINGVVDKMAYEDKRTRNESLNTLINDSIVKVLAMLERESTKRTISLPKLFIQRPGDEKILRLLAEIKYEVHPDLLNLSVLGPGGAQYFAYSQNTYLSDMIRKLSKRKSAVIRMRKKIWSKRSDFLNQMMDNTTRANVKILTMSSFMQDEIGDSGREYLKINRIEDYLMKMYAFERGYVALPTLADKRTYFYIDGLTPINFDINFNDSGDYEFPDEVIELFYNYALDEKERIDEAKRVIEDYNTETDPIAKQQKAEAMWSNYHYRYRSGGNIDTTVANATKYMLFPSFNKKEFDFYRDAKNEIKSILKARVNEEMLYAEYRGMIGGTTNDKGIFKPFYAVRLDDNTLTKYEAEYGNTQQAITNMFARHTIRTIQSGIEFSKIIAGDPAFKKVGERGTVQEDYIKRLSGLLSTGDVANNLSSEYGILAKNYNVSTMFTQTFNLEKLYKENIYQHIFEAVVAEYVKDAVKRPGYENIGKLSFGRQVATLKRDFGIDVRKRLSGYKEIDSTDGQAWISPTMYRELSIRVGDWGPNKEEAFNLLQSDKDLTQEEYTKSLEVFLQPLKFVSYGLMEDDNLNVPIYDKMAMMTIFRQMTKFGLSKDKRAEINEMLDRMEAKGKYAGSKPIHMIKIIKVAKTGDKLGFKFYKNVETGEVNDFTNIPVYEQPFDLLRRQLLTDPHEQSRTKAGTQMIKMGMADLQMEEEIYSNPIIEELEKRSTITGRELADIIVNTISGITGKGKDRLMKRLGFENGEISLPMLANTLRKDSIKAGAADLIVDAFKVDKDGKLYLELDAFPNRKYLYSRLISMFAKEVIDMKLPGNQFIQVSHLGMRLNADDELKWSDVRVNEGKTRVFEMECYVSINLFKQVIPNYDELTYEEKRAFILKHSDTIMGYRIPTQGQNSVFVMKIKDVLPENTGDMIVLPPPFTTLTGSDFDIDKVYVMRHNYSIKKDGSAHKVQFHNTLEAVWEERAIRYNWLYNLFGIIDSMQLTETAPDYPIAQIVDYGKIKGKGAGLTKLISKISSFIDDEMMDESDKEDLINRISINSMGDFFDVGTYNKLKNLVGTKIEDRKKFFMNKYNNETNPYKFNSRGALENLLLDSYKNVYLNLAHIRQTATPLSAETETLRKLAHEVHEYDRTRPTGDLSMFAPSTQADVKFDYNTGKEGIGPFALSNVHHALCQVAGIKFKHATSEGLLNEDENGNIDISQIYGKIRVPITDDDGNIIEYRVVPDGVSIMSWLSALIDLHVDVAKDPFVAWLNLNGATYDVAALLVRGGFGLDTFKFLCQPAIKMYADYMIDSSGDSKIRRFDDAGKVLEAVRGHYMEKLGNATATTYSLQDLMNGDEMMRNIKKTGAQLNTAEHASKQLQYLDTFIKFKGTGAKLGELMQASQIDTKKFGKSVTSIIAFKDRIDRIVAADEFVGLDRLFNITNSDVPSFLGSYYDNFLTFTLKSLSNLSIYSTDVFNKLLSDVYKLSGAAFSSNKRALENISDEIISAIFAKYFNDPDYEGLTPDKLITIFKDVQDFVTNVKHSDDPMYKELRENNELIKMFNKAPLDAGLSVEELPFESMLVIPNKDLSDKFNYDSLTYSWRDLFKHKDPRARQFATNLLYYSFITSGFRNRMLSFHNFIPPQNLREFNTNSKAPQNTFNEFVAYQRELMQSDLTYGMYAHIVDEVFINNWSDTTLVPRVTNKERDFVLYNIGDRQTTEPTVVGIRPNKRGINRGNNALGKPVFNKYLTTRIKIGEQYKTYLLKYIGFIETVDKNYVSTTPVYKVIPKRSYQSGGFVVKEYLFDKSVIKANNVEFIPDGQEAQSILTKQNVKDNPMLRLMELVDDYDLVSKKDTETRNVWTGEVVEEEANLPDIKDVVFTKGKLGIGEEISSYVRDSFGFPLTNPVITTPSNQKWSRTNESEYQRQWRNYFLANKIVYKDKEYLDVEQAYQQNKENLSKEERLNLMVDLIAIKFKTYPRFLEGVSIKAKQKNVTPIQYLADCTHNPTKKATLWESSGSNWFVKALTEAYIRVTGDAAKTTTPSTPTQPSTGKIIKATDKYRRGAVKVDKSTLYIFTDNTDRTSGDDPNVTGWYADKYGKGLSYGTDNNPTTAVIRGLDNAYPISTMKWFYKKHNATVEQSRWVDTDIDIFSKVIDDEINQIKEAWNTGKYSRIVVPGGDGFFNSNIANISKERTPKLYAYLDSKIEELNNYISTKTDVTQESTMEEFPFDSSKAGSTIFSTENKEVYDLVVQLGITDWSDVTPDQWKQLRDKYAHCK